MKSIIPLFGLLVISSIAAQAQIISFASTNGSYPNGEVIGLGAIGVSSSDLWNQFYDGRNNNNPSINGYNGVVTNALDSQGNATGVGINIFTGNPTNLTKGGATSDGGLNPVLFGSYAKTTVDPLNATSTQISFTGLSANTNYDLYLYGYNQVGVSRPFIATIFDGTTEIFADTPATTFTSVVTQTSLPTSSSSGLTATGNYINLAEISDGSGNLTVTLTQSGGSEIDLFGGQLIAAVPEPTTMAMIPIGAGFLMLVMYHRRRQVQV